MGKNSNNQAIMIYVCQNRISFLTFFLFYCLICDNKVRKGFHIKAQFRKEKNYL